MKIIKVQTRDGILYLEESIIDKIGLLREKYKEQNNQDFYINVKKKDINDIIDILTFGIQDCATKFRLNCDHDTYEYCTLLLKLYNI